MKSSAAIIWAAAAAAVSAQVSYITTVVYEDCSTDSNYEVTITKDVTITSCPACTERPTSSIKTHSTVYVTEYDYICTTGATPVITPTQYTVTETCTGPTPHWPAISSPGYIPPGFTTTVTVCNRCAARPTTVTLTVLGEASTTPTSPAALLTPLPHPPAHRPVSSPPKPPSTSMVYPYPDGNETTTTVQVCPGHPACGEIASPTTTTAPLAPMATVIPFLNAAPAAAPSAGWPAFIAAAMGAFCGAVLLL